MKLSGINRLALISIFIVIFLCDAVIAAPLERDPAGQDEERETAKATAPLPQGVRCLRDIPYGSDPLQRFDVYASEHVKDAPVIFMVHGGAWRWGDKTLSTVVENKARRWTERGFIFISVNYRLLPAADILTQEEDVLRALAEAQNRAKSWGGNPSKFILMGHSAGAHLIALAAAAPSRAYKAGIKPWLGAVLLDSAVLDVADIMNRGHFRIYDWAFGKQPAYWQSASPLSALSSRTPPLLAVCSAQRDNSCSQARTFIAKASALGSRAEVLEQDLSHREINESLGTDSAYTGAIEVFMGSLDPLVKKLLTHQ